MEQKLYTNTIERVFCFHVKFLIKLKKNHLKKVCGTFKANTYDEPSELEIECRLPARVGTTSIDRCMEPADERLRCVVTP